MEFVRVGSAPHALLIITLSALTYTGIALIISEVLKRYRIPEELKSLEKVGKKAGISRKKRVIAAIRQRRVRGRLTRLMVFQMFIPMAAFLGIALLVMGYVDAIASQTACLLPPPLQVEKSGPLCLTPSVWLILFVFFLFSPIYGAIFQRSVGGR